MKNLPLILIAVLFVAVAALYYLHFAKKTSAIEVSSTITPGSLTMAYINSDSIVKYYDYVKASSEILDAKAKKLDQDLRNRAQSFQSDVESFQRNQSNMTIGQAKAVEEDLGKKQQNLQLYQQSLSQEVSNDEAKLRQSLYLRITTFLNKYAKEKGLQVVFKFDQSSALLYGSAGLDVTKDVVAGLNEEYKAEKSLPAANNDSLVKKKK